MKHLVTESSTLCYATGNPIEHYGRWMRSDSLLLVDFDLQPYWLAGSDALPLTAIYHRDGQGQVSVSVTDSTLVATHDNIAQQYAAWAQEHRFVRCVSGQPLALADTCIAKPWGQEVWFSGVEERGVCCIKSSEGETPIPWLQAAMPGEAIGKPGKPLILLKILDPVADPVQGDLYFELHEEKREVYVVTHIDEQAWPDGTGYIRFGFAPDKRVPDDDDCFRAAYLQAVRRYEKTRRIIDSAGTTTPQLIEEERLLRADMDSYTAMIPLQVGDVIKVPLLTPHALQHGVRTVEFQTPVYERKILSFAQKVLTQDHWDTEEAVAKMDLTAPRQDKFEVLLREEGILVERIVDFCDFEVQRVRLEAGRRLTDLTIKHYALLMVVEGHLELAGTHYGPEQALLLPREWCDFLVGSQPPSTLVFLLALPRNAAVES